MGETCLAHVSENRPPVREIDGNELDSLEQVC
jgi:hypothetical protein